MAFIDKTKNEIEEVIYNNIDKFYVYSINASGTPFYVGKGKNKRIFYHEYESNNYKNIKSYNLNMLKINKFNKTVNNNGLTYSIFSFYNIEEDAFKNEKLLVEKYGRIDTKTGCLTNMTSGGDGVPELNETSKQSMINKLTGRVGPNKGKSFNKEWKDNLSKAKKGCTSWNDGIKLSKETRLKMSNSKKGISTWNKGLVMSNSTRHKISESKKGFVVSGITKSKISTTLKNKSDVYKKDITKKRLKTRGNFMQSQDSKTKSSESNKKTAKIKTQLYYDIKNYINDNDIDIKMFRYGKSIQFMENFFKEIKENIDGIY